MTVRIVRLGQPRVPHEGTRLGTVRRPPRGVPRADFARKDWYDVWFPVLAPSLPLMKQALAASTDRQWTAAPVPGREIREICRGVPSGT